VIEDDEMKFRRKSSYSKLNEGSYQVKINKIAKDLKNRVFSNVAVIAGAGISRSAGIPDFRSDKGLY
jgi:hypothetical protein